MTTRLRILGGLTFLVTLAAASLHAEPFSWESTGGPDPTRAVSISGLALNDAGDLFAATTWNGSSSQALGVFHSSDGGAAWHPINGGLANTNVPSIIEEPPGNILIGTHGSGVYRLSAGQSQWTSVGLVGRHVTALLATGDVLFAADGYWCTGIYRSTDRGTTWASANTGLHDGCINAFVVNSSGDVFAGSGASGMYRSSDGGVTWQRTISGLTSLNIGSLAINRQGHVFAGAVNAGVFRSTDNGATWHSRTSGIPQTYLLTVAVGPGDDLFASVMEHGVYWSTDGGGTWAAIDTGLEPLLTPGRGIIDFAFISEGQIFAAPVNFGLVFRTDGSRFLDFPLEGKTPSAAAVSAVFDHSVPTDSNGPLFYAPGINRRVSAFTGDAAEFDPSDRNSANDGQFIFSEAQLQECSTGVRRSCSVGYEHPNGDPFILQGMNYTGGTCPQVSGGACNRWLFYEGHPGYDYPAVGWPIVAPADGTLFIPAADPITSRNNPRGAVATYSIVAIDHGLRWGGERLSTWYLHVGCQGVGAQCPEGSEDRRVKPSDNCRTFGDFQAGRCALLRLETQPVTVRRGDVIGFTGNKGVKGYHLHFEARKGLDSHLRCLLPQCAPVDPYGGPTVDPYPSGPNWPMWR